MEAIVSTCENLITIAYYRLGNSMQFDNVVHEELGNSRGRVGMANGTKMGILR
jgi:hypothetical protein